MLEWIARNHQILSLLANFSMLIVWIAYLQIFVSNYRRQKRPKILINRGAGSGLGSRCLVSNMSAEAIYVSSIMATLETADGRPMTCSITDLEDQEELEALSDLKLPTRQGPLLAGHVRDIGPFHSLVHHVLRNGTHRRGEVDPFIRNKLSAIEITIVAVYGSEDLLTGAKRRFDIVRREGDLYVKARTIETEQIRSRRERRKISDILKQDF